MSSTVTMYTDGSARGNPGPGGYGTILMSGHTAKNYRKAIIILPTTEWN